MMSDEPAATVDGFSFATRVLWMLVSVALLAFGVGWLLAPDAVHPVDSDRIDKVVVVTLPRLTWERFEQVRPKRLTEEFERAAVANMSVRTIGPTTGPADAYLTLGAGNRATGRNVDGRRPAVELRELAEPGRIMEAAEPLDIGPPFQVFEAQTGSAPSGDAVVTGIAGVIRSNERLHYGAVGGALAEALSSANRTVAAIGNADLDSLRRNRRDVAYLAMRPDGVVPHAAVGTRLVSVDPSSPAGTALNNDVVVDEFVSAVDDNDVVAVELSDLERAENALALSPSGYQSEVFGRAMRRTDELLGRLIDEIDRSSTLLIVLGPTAPISQTSTTVFAMSGPGIEPGIATSSTTRRDGYVTLTDIAPTILSAFDIQVPESMTDTRLATRVDSAPFSERVDRLVSDAHLSVARDAALAPLSTVYIVALGLMLAIAVLCMWRFEGLTRLVDVWALSLMAVLPLNYLLRLAPTHALGTWGQIILLGAASFAAGLTAERLGRGRPLVAPALIAGFLWLLLMVDVAVGSPLQMGTPFGYSAIVAGRFAGFGNQAFSMLAIAALLLCTALVELDLPAGPTGRRPAVTAASALLAVSVIADGLPALGSDVGGVLALAPSAVVVVMVLVGRRVSMRLLVALGAGAGVVLGVFAGLDLLRPPESRTHLGRFAESVVDGDLMMILARKLEANLGILRSSAWTAVVPAALAFIAYLTWRPSASLQRIRDAHWSFAAFGAAGVVCGVLAMLLNDSGVSMPAMMLALGLGYTIHLALEERRVSR